MVEGILITLGAVCVGFFVAATLSYYQIRRKFKKSGKDIKINLDDCE